MLFWCDLLSHRLLIQLCNYRRRSVLRAAKPLQCLVEHVAEAPRRLWATSEARCDVTLSIRAVWTFAVAMRDHCSDGELNRDHAIVQRSRRG
jgi:hypothetical protein